MQVCPDFGMMDVLLGFDALACGLAQDVAKLCRRLLPIGAGQAFGTNR